MAFVQPPTPSGTNPGTKLSHLDDVTPNPLSATALSPPSMGRSCASFAKFRLKEFIYRL